MDDRGDLSDIWGEEEEEEEGDEEASGDENRDSGIPSLGDFERMQKAQVETITKFAPPPQPAKRARINGITAVYVEPCETISLVERHRLDYNRNFNARRDEWLDTSEEEEEQDQRPGTDDDDDEEEAVTQSPSSSPSRDAVAESCKSCGRENQRARPPKKRQRVTGPAEEEQEFDIMCRPECLLCSHGKNDIDTEQVANLKYLLKENIGVRSDVEVARMLHLYYKKNIYPNSDLPMLSTASVLNHIETMHSKNARMFISAQIDDEAMMYRLFRNKVWRADGSWDEKALKEYRASKRELRLLFMMRQEKMNFNEGATADDQSREAKFIQLTAHFDKEQVRKKKPTTPFRI